MTVDRVGLLKELEFKFMVYQYMAQSHNMNYADNGVTT